MDPLTFYKLDVQGIVYLVDPATGAAYTFDITNPVKIGQIVWTDPKAEPRIQLLSDWKEILAAKCDPYALPND